MYLMGRRFQRPANQLRVMGMFLPRNPREMPIRKDAYQIQTAKEEGGVMQKVMYGCQLAVKALTVVITGMCKRRDAEGEEGDTETCIPEDM